VLHNRHNGGYERELTLLLMAAPWKRKRPQKNQKQFKIAKIAKIRGETRI